MTRANRNTVSPSECIQLLLRGGRILDVRSESEHRFASVPGMLVEPILNDAERHEVGTCFRRQGQDAAISLGQDLVAGAKRTERIDKWIRLCRDHSIQTICCARGGLRSQTAQEWLAEANVDVSTVSGGYKALRGALMSNSDRVLEELPAVVLAGKTGSGKSDLLRLPPFQGLGLDLEKHAGHCGSAFGGLFGPQPSQATFENRVCLDLIRLQRSRAWMLVEDESAHIGQVRLVSDLASRIASAPAIVVERPFDERVENICRLYVESYPPDWRDEKPCRNLELFLQSSLAKISERLGGARTKECRILIDTAVAEHEAGNGTTSHRSWIAYLLREYYDPLYDRALVKRKQTILFTGSPSEVVERLEWMLHRIPGRDVPVRVSEQAFD